MRYLVLSDIHSNIEALDAVIERAKQAGYTQVLCCGDIVGYGPNPVEVMDTLASLQPICIRGNHDRVASGLDEPTYFSLNARLAVEWTRTQLPESHRQRLAELPLGPLGVGQAQLVHGSFLDEDEYLYTETDAAKDLALTQRRLTFFGHTHIASAFTVRHREVSRWVPTYSNDAPALFSLEGTQFLVNPGSVGQPRDGDWRASFVIWDLDTEILEFYRSEYEVTLTQEKMRKVGLPAFLSSRLSLGR